MSAARRSSASFEEHLAREIGASERLRAAVLVWILGAMIAFFALDYALFRELAGLGGQICF